MHRASRIGPDPKQGGLGLASPPESPNTLFKSCAERI